MSLIARASSKLYIIRSSFFEVSNCYYCFIFFLQVFIVFGSLGYLFIYLFFLFRSPDFQSVVVVTFLKIKFLGLSDLFISIYRIGYWNFLEFLI